MGGCIECLVSMHFFYESADVRMLSADSHNCTGRTTSDSGCTMHRQTHKAWNVITVAQQLDYFDDATIHNVQ